MYAVVELSGKQHKVEVDQTLDIDLQKAEKGSKITFENVLLLADGDNVQIGQPYLENASVTAEVMDIVKGEKLSILRFRRRKHSMRKIGHRQKFTKIQIKEIKACLNLFDLDLSKFLPVTNLSHAVLSSSKS